MIDIRYLRLHVALIYQFLLRLSVRGLHSLICPTNRRAVDRIIPTAFVKVRGPRVRRLEGLGTSSGGAVWEQSLQ